MTPYDLVAVSRSAVAAIFSLSNFVFYHESGYWDSASELKPLLHTWSLGVEEQFYLFWPTLVLGLLAIRQTISFRSSLLLIVVAGAALCIWFTTIDQSAAFYLLPFRVFQFALGALLFSLTQSREWAELLGSRWLQAFVFWSGLLSIVVGVFSLNGATIYPGWAVVLPTAGAALLLLSGSFRGNSYAPARILMENSLSAWVGKISYAMYLVHWPLIALFRYQYGLELSPSDQLLLGTATLLAAIALHYGVERHFYHRSAESVTGAPQISGARFSLSVFVVAGALALVATSAWQGGGWSWRFPSLSLSDKEIRQGKMARARNAVHACKLRFPDSTACNNDAETQILVLGDSHELDGFNFLNAAFGADKSLNIALFGTSNKCTDLHQKAKRFYSSNPQCQIRLDVLFDPVRVAQLDVVFYAANKPYSAIKASLLAMLKKLKAMNPAIDIVTLGGYINTNRPCAFYINKTNSTDACALPENNAYFADNPSDQDLFQEFKAIESFYIDQVALLCKNRVLQTCLTRASDDTPAFYDRHHKSIEFAEMSGKMYIERHPDLLLEIKEH